MASKDQRGIQTHVGNYANSVAVASADNGLHLGNKGSGNISVDVIEVIGTDHFANHHRCIRKYVRIGGKQTVIATRIALHGAARQAVRRGPVTQQSNISIKANASGHIGQVVFVQRHDYICSSVNVSSSNILDHHISFRILLGTHAAFGTGITLCRAARQPARRQTVTQQSNISIKANIRGKVTKTVLIQRHIYIRSSVNIGSSNILDHHISFRILLGTHAAFGTGITLCRAARQPARRQTVTQQSNISIKANASGHIGQVLFVLRHIYIRSSVNIGSSNIFDHHIRSGVRVGLCCWGFGLVGCFGRCAFLGTHRGFCHHVRVSLDSAGIYHSIRVGEYDIGFGFYIRNRCHLCFRRLRFFGNRVVLFCCPDGNISICNYGCFSFDGLRFSCIGVVQRCLIDLDIRVHYCSGRLGLIDGLRLDGSGILSCIAAEFYVGNNISHRLGCEQFGVEIRACLETEDLGVIRYGIECHVVRDYIHVRINCHCAVRSNRRLRWFIFRG
ncbi:hypothetical protein AC20117_13505 [Arthrobacter crystallopoietes]|nr:hypothetical protein AC20117_13505 [Arthrobacter crystallopoietes]